MIEIIYFLVLLGMGYFIGSLVEKQHYECIKERESAFLNLPAVTSKNLIEDNMIIEDAKLVYGSVVISQDYFKLILSGLRNIIGGEVSPYETMLDRGRREAILRLKEKAYGADIILNLRIETCQIGFSGSAEVLAYGTAVYYRK